jgi:hypothetical protein
MEVKLTKSQWTKLLNRWSEITSIVDVGATDECIYNGTNSYNGFDISDVSCIMCKKLFGDLIKPNNFIIKLVPMDQDHEKRIRKWKRKSCPCSLLTKDKIYQRVKNVIENRSPK